MSKSKIKVLLQKNGKYLIATVIEEQLPGQKAETLTLIDAAQIVPVPSASDPMGMAIDFTPAFLFVKDSARVQVAADFFAMIEEADETIEAGYKTKLTGIITQPEPKLIGSK